MPGAIIAAFRCPHVGPAFGFIVVASVVEPFTPSLVSHPGFAFPDYHSLAACLITPGDGVDAGDPWAR
jgi:hypothetical protein